MFIRRFVGRSLIGLCWIIGHGTAQDFTGPEGKPDGKPDILWRRKSSSDTWVWQMDGLRFTGQSTMIGWSQQDTLWKIVGTGDFNGDGNLDILWRHEVRDLIGVWHMNGTNRIGTARIEHYPGNAWRIAGAGDFGSVTNDAVTNVLDGKADIVWQEKGTEKKAVWLMDGAAMKANVTVDTNSPDWRVVAIGDFGSSSSATEPDGRPDMVLSNLDTGRVAIWYMDGTKKVSEHQVWNTLTEQPFSFAHDKDLQITGAGDYTLDGKTDLLVRHATDGRNFVWSLDGANFLREYTLSASAWDPDWRMAAQDLEDSKWRLKPMDYAAAMLAVSASDDSSSGLELKFIDFPTTRPMTYTLNRREVGSNQFERVASELKPPRFSDTNVNAGVIYEYEVKGETDRPDRLVLTARAARDAPAIESRGRVLLVIERNLASRLGTSLDAFTDDLVGDGWSVASYRSAPRHRDANWNASQSRAVERIKSWIKERYDESPVVTHCVILLGHVAVPYSGTDASDGHATHRGTWSADAFYGDVSGRPWRAPGEGQFMENYIPSDLELAVGRIDFSRLPSFGADTSSSITKEEVSLIQRYFAKNHRYRHGLNPYPLPDQAIFTSYFPTLRPLQDNAKINSTAFFGDYESSVTVGDPFRNNTFFRNSSPPTPCLWAFASGPGSWNQIYNMQTGLRYTTAMLQEHSDAPVAFWSVLGSYFADFNCDDNLCRALLATPNYGLVVLPSSSGTGGPRWNLERMALGETIGEAFRASVNATLGPYRWLNIQGDPTLRLHTVKPPANVTAEPREDSIHLKWQSGENGCVYNVYRAASPEGPFERVNDTPLKDLHFEVQDDPKKRTYMVRALKGKRTGRGSYWNISQGTTATLK